MRFQIKRCVACRWPRSSGYITFDGELHEPHCLSCLCAWEKTLRQKPAREVIGLREYRAWQAERAKKMGVAA